MEILPLFPEFREICLEDKTDLERALYSYEPRISEYTFTNLFVWKNVNKVLVSQVDETILVKRFKSEFKQFFLLPPIGDKNIIDSVNEMLSIDGQQDFPGLYGIDKTHAESLQSAGYSIQEMRNDWDYVYLVKNLIDLPGEKYYAKRKHIKKCLDTYEPEYKPITKDIIDQCLALQTSWCNLRECDAVPELEAENEAIKDTFLHFSNFNVFGGVILIDGRVEAFTIGERLNKDTAVVHFEKANPNIVGLYQVINQEFCFNALQSFTYVNREQDLGIHGLRKAKMSYHPAFFIEKYLAII